MTFAKRGRTFSSALLGLLATVVVIAIPVALLLNGLQVGRAALPWLSSASMIAFAVCALVLAPLGAIRRTRSLAATCLLLSSYLFGLTAWFMGLVLTWTLWGGGAVFVGLILMGVGVVPMGLLATLFRGDWGPFLLLLGAIIATFAVRAYSLYFAATSVSPFGEA